MNQLWSNIEQAWRNTLIHQAELEAHDRIASMYGCDRPRGEVGEDEWRHALFHLALGPRGTYATTFEVVRAIFWSRSVVVEGTVDASNPTELVANNVLEWPYSGDEMVGKLIEVDGRTLFTVSQAGATVTVCDLDTAFWDAPAWDHTGVEAKSFRVLPFVVHVRQPGRVSTYDPSPTPTIPSSATLFTFGERCLYEVIYFDTDEGSLHPTYLSPNHALTPSGIPLGGVIMEGTTVVDGVSTIDSADPDGDGPYPIYLAEPGVFPQATMQLGRSLAASVEALIYLNPQVAHV
jgi:hypothetical protein